MREIVVISGKGGTGKTSVTASFAFLARGSAMLCDLDVDAPDLHLLLAPDRAETHDFRSGFEAVIDPEACTNCGLCAGMCRFGAVRPGPRAHSVDALRCEGCGVCERFCPSGAATMREKFCGRWHVSATRMGPMIHAQLFPGEENSGRLVALLKKEARARAKTLGLSLMLCDGAPGIGCPVISSLSGATRAVIVTEPTPSGRHDLLRVAELCRHFGIPAAVLVNKFDLNPAGGEEIEAVCRELRLDPLGRLPHDEAVARAMARGLCVAELPEAPVSRALRDAWERLCALPDTSAARPDPFHIKPS
ncbi:MAG: (4Fe-4S)-binding protein [Desulfovibrionaceae bacterium CG1_02_65_16]|nr:MAG: (4Fe-4S)-binding protein [Desulfovibrionaceae bacterium CG1_02_65_16]